MVFGQMGLKHPSLGGMVAAIQSKITREALHYRFSKAASAFLFKCLDFVLKQRIRGIHRIGPKLLQPFGKVVLFDSSSWNVSDKLRDVLPGSGGNGSRATCKLQLAYDYKESRLHFVDVTPGLTSDNRYTDRLPEIVQKNDLLIFDQGFFKLSTLAAVARKGAYFLIRFFLWTTLWNPDTQEAIDLRKTLVQCLEKACEMDVLMGTKKRSQIRCRLIALRVNENIAKERRRKLRKEAKRKGRTLSKLHLTMCDWTLLVTNVPDKWLPLEMARALYSVRWQIELIFKQFKSILSVHHSRTAKEDRLRCELYGKLIGAVIIHGIHAAAAAEYWNKDNKEVSMEKLYKRVQERAFSLHTILLSSLSHALAYLRQELKIIIPSSLKIPQPSRLTTLQILELQWDPMLDIDLSLPQQCAA